MISFCNPSWRYADLSRWKTIWYDLYEVLGWRWEWKDGDRVLIEDEILFYSVDTVEDDLDGAIPLPPPSVLLVMAQRLSETSLESKHAPDIIHMASKRLLDSWRHLESKENSEEVPNTSDEVLD